MWSVGLIYGCSSAPDTPAETFAEHVVIRGGDCICLHMTSPPPPGQEASPALAESFAVALEPAQATYLRDRKIHECHPR
jgi:hypothetical protein